MNKRRILVAFATSAIFASSAIYAFEFETIELMDLPNEIRHDIYRYILHNVDQITNPAEARLVQRAEEVKVFVVRLKYGRPEATTMGGIGIWIICTYFEMKRQQCSMKYQTRLIDPPLPEFQQPLVPDETRSNNPLESDGKAAPQLGR